MPRLRRLRSVLAVSILAAVNAADAPKPSAPTLSHFFPVAAVRGTTSPVTAVGKFTPWPPQVWTDVPGIAFLPGEKPGQFNVEVGPEVPVGPHLVRCFNERGASAPRFLVVTERTEAAETEPNDDYATAPAAGTLPVTINGRLGKTGDVDCYAVRLEAGQTLRASLDAYVLGSPLDAVLRIVDTVGRERALNHDNGRNPDPALTWTAPSAGTFVLQVFGFAHPATSDVRFAGSDAGVYRLHLALGAAARPAFPPVARPAWHEEEHVARTGDAAAPAPPFSVTGRIGRAGERDRFPFTAEKGESLVLSVEAASLGFPLDAWLAVEDATGKELARNDDHNGGADPLLEWTAPKAGKFAVAVGSVLHRSGPDYQYRLNLQRPQPGFQGVITESGFTVEPGKSARIKVAARRIQGFKTPLTASVAGLPAGVSAQPVQIGAAEKDVTLEVIAAPDAPPFSGPFQIHFREDGDGTLHPARHELVSTTLKNGVPQGFRDLVITSTTELWLTVLSAPKPKSDPDTPPPPP